VLTAPLLRPKGRRQWRRRTLATTLPLESVVPAPGWPLPSYMTRIWSAMSSTSACSTLKASYLGGGGRRGGWGKAGERVVGGAWLRVFLVWSNPNPNEVIDNLEGDGW